MRIRRLMIGALVLCAVSGCASALKTKQAQGFTPGAKVLRVAVLPLEKSDNGQDEVEQMFREELYANLQEGPYRLVEIIQTDEALKKLGAQNAQQAAALLAKNPKGLQEALGADAVLQGKIMQWSLTYLAIHSEVKLEVEESLVNLSDNQELMRVSKGIARASGITKIPTGLIAAGTAPIFGLTKGVQQRVIDDLARDIALAMSGQKPEGTS